MRRFRLFYLALALTLVPLGCDDDGASAGPVPGELVVRLDTPNDDDGALIATIHGPSTIEAVDGPDSSGPVHYRERGDTVLAAAFGDLEDGAVLRISVPDVRQADQFTATLVEVADRQGALRSDLSTYSLSVRR